MSSGAELPLKYSDWTEEKKEKSRQATRAHRARNREALAKRNREHLRERYATKHAEVRAKARAWVEANRERVRETDRKSRARNIERIRVREAAKQERLKRDRPEKAREYQRRADARQRLLRADVLRERDNARHKMEGRIPGFAELWAAVLADHNHSCAYCGQSGVPLEQDHFEPLSRGGKHEIDNLVPACRRCNRSKGAKSYIVWLAIQRSRIQLRVAA